MHHVCPKLFKEYTAIYRITEISWSTAFYGYCILQILFSPCRLLWSKPRIAGFLSHGQDNKYHPCHEAKYKDLDPKDWGAGSVDIWNMVIKTHLIKLALVSTALKKGLARHRVPQGHYCSSILVATVYHGVSLIELEVGMLSGLAKPSYSLAYAEVMPYWEETIAPMLKQGKTVFVAAHGNSIRAIVKMRLGSRLKDCGW